MISYRKPIKITLFSKVLFIQLKLVIFTKNAYMWCIFIGLYCTYNKNYCKKWIFFFQNSYIVFIFFRNMQQCCFSYLNGKFFIRVTTLFLVLDRKIFHNPYVCNPQLIGKFFIIYVAALISLLDRDGFFLMLYSIINWSVSEVISQ